MRKSTILLIFIFLYCAASKAQDKIITTSGDTILCRILDISAANIHYEQTQKDGFTIGKFIPAERVHEYLTSTSKTKNKSRFVSPPPKRFRLSLTGGYAHLTSSFSEERQLLSSYTTFEQLDKYYSGLKNELNLGLDFHFLLNDHLGVGVKHSLFTASTELNCVVPSFGSGNTLQHIPEYVSIHQKEKICINYAGPSFFFRQWLDKRHKLALNEFLSLGYAFYREETLGDKYQSKYPNSLTTCGNFAGNLALALEYYLHCNFSVSAGAGYFYSSFKDGTFHSVNPTTDDVEERPYSRATALKMSNIHLSLGLQYYF